MTDAHRFSTEALKQESRRILQAALNFPGTTFQLPLNRDVSTITGLALAANALIQRDTPFFTPDADFTAYLQRDGGVPVPADQAAYHFYRTLDDASLKFIQLAPVQINNLPDSGATLILGCILEAGDHIILTDLRGQRRTLDIVGVPKYFWALRAAALQPLQGWDVLFVQGRRVIGIPATTTVERIP